ncbi:GNAT family N-acetyltransferase [Bacillus atrophaeus]|uniref:GNAT family N-acetyltransferase n=1 Tax=Bacillus atrophaeus TaxID=1452 RepID=UPI00387368F4
MFEEAVDFFWGQWGNPDNYAFYRDCITHSFDSRSVLLPRFYIAVQNDSIIGSYALLRNDLISRQDLFPWLACLFVVPKLRGNEIGCALLRHALKEAHIKGFENLYLCTDLEGYYEKYGWVYIKNGYIFNGEPAKIYKKAVEPISEN